MIKNFLKVITAWDTKKTMKNKKITRIFEKNGKKNVPRLQKQGTFEVLIKIKKIESILADLAHRRIGYPPGACERWTQNQKYAGGFTPRGRPR